MNCQIKLSQLQRTLTNTMSARIADSHFPRISPCLLWCSRETSALHRAMYIKFVFFILFAHPLTHKMRQKVGCSKIIFNLHLLGAILSSLASVYKCKYIFIYIILYLIYKVLCLFALALVFGTNTLKLNKLVAQCGTNDLSRTLFRVCNTLFLVFAVINEQSTVIL